MKPRRAGFHLGVGRQSTPLEPVGPIARLSVLCFESRYDNRVVFYKVDEREGEFRKNVSPGTCDVLWPTMRGFGNDRNCVVQFAKK